MTLIGRVLGTALLVGGGALAIAAVVAAPKLLRASRPVVREAMRRGFGLYERARAAAAEFVDDVEDLVAEVRTDISDERSAARDEAPVEIKRA
jgi:hypothetical protein